MDTNSKTYFPIVFSSDDSFSIVNNGTAAAPCRLTVIPQNDVMLMTITGLSDEPIKMNQVKSKQILVIDGINRTVTLDGKQAFDKYDAWEFPRLMPGTNTISITNSKTSDINVEYQPRYI